MNLTIVKDIAHDDCENMRLEIDLSSIGLRTETSEGKRWMWIALSHKEFDLLCEEVKSFRKAASELGVDLK